jgi:hypothetical protein
MAAVWLARKSDYLKSPKPKKAETVHSITITIQYAVGSFFLLTGAISKVPEKICQRTATKIRIAIIAGLSPSKKW